MTLRAILPILHRSTQYRPGDTLPADDARTVDAWIEAGSATWVDDEEPAAPAAKAKCKTAQPGITGKSSDGDPEALAGRIPDKPERKRKRKKV